MKVKFATGQRSYINGDFMPEQVLIAVDGAIACPTEWQTAIAINGHSRGIIYPRAGAMMVFIDGDFITVRRASEAAAYRYHALVPTPKGRRIKAFPNAEDALTYQLGLEDLKKA